jgi:hypothetical protein
VSSADSRHCTAMSCVKRGRCVFPSFFSYFKSSSLLSFRASPSFRKRFPGGGGRLFSRCSSCYPCTAPQGRHTLTPAVIARKRARPISKSGRCQPQCVAGRAPFQIFSDSFHACGGGQSKSQRVRSSDHDPTQLFRLHSPGAPAPQIHRHLPGDGHDGFLPGGFAGLGIAQNGPPLLRQLARRLP